ncbi:transketolase, partial [Pelagibacterales bacterium SAG-MED03]|nr:transketolase [Pelagibacterales bacterium SAG-MED03]
SELTLNALTKENNNLIGGSADLAGSNNTKTKYHKIIKPGSFDSDYIHYGVREHAMSGIMNGLALHSSIIPYGGTFLIFSDYCKPSIRLSALMQQRVIYVMTHDSIGLGEDGPTHQPIEQLSGLRSIPNLNVFRPADRMETIECWELSLKNSKTPSILSLTRQNLDPIRKKYSKMNKCSFGAYEVLRTNKKISLTILASGSEVNLAIETSHKLAKDRIYCKVISMPSQDLFNLQSNSYKKKILNETKIKISIEAASTDCWKKYIGNDGLAFGIDTFGKSAPFKEIYKYFGLTATNIAKKTKNLIRR